MTPEGNNLPDVNSTSGLDIFGLGGVAKYLAGPIVQGIGRVLKPLAHRLDNAAQIANWNAWDEALKVKGYEAKVVDLTLGERAEVRMVAEAITRQDNREAIAIEAINHGKTLTADPSIGQLPLPDADWIERFWRLAENVSQPNMREFWGVVLARRSTGKAAFSARALEFLSTLSGDEARKLERIAQFSVIHYVDEGVSDHAVMNHLSDHTDRLDSERKKELEAFNKRLHEFIGNIDTPLFGSLGIYIESGWAHSILQKPKGGKICFTVAGTSFEAVVPPGHVDEHGFYYIGGSTGLAPLGRELIGMIAPEPDERYFDLLSEGFKIKGIELQRVAASSRS
ncbi:DUF2806 domain-containing protein [Rhizobium puerariae]|uniref:DUF2806 domain-containing protein n=1 Tax=Rhizobium puerariae TaxID=1585791 RepID=A0ABV6ATQ7_9HYPH